MGLDAHVKPGSPEALSGAHAAVHEIQHNTHLFASIRN
jgi:hypothetical protein